MDLIAPEPDARDRERRSTAARRAGDAPLSLEVARCGLAPLLAVAAATLLAVLPASIFAQDAGHAELHRQLESAVDRVAPDIIDVRHRIHRHPELGNRETETAALVAERLRELGYDRVETGVAHTGVVAVLEGGRPGPVVAVRADMDALPVKERTGLPFASTDSATWNGQRVPVMHACGHDIHTSVGLGVASVLAAVRDELPGTVKMIFQPAEEGPPEGEEGGAELMQELGVLEEPRPGAVFALHAFPDLEVGQVGWTPGPALAAVDHFYVTVRGEQSHGAYPHLGVDPVVMASQAVTALQTIRSRNLDPLEPSVVTVGMFHGGERFNIIPSEVKLEGTIRTYSDSARDDVERRMGEILDGITRAGGGSYELRYDRVTPATINHPEMAREGAAAIADVLGDESVVQVEPVMGGEDFAYFSREVPGFYFRLGTTNPEYGSGGLHTPDFRGDDAAIPVGIRAMSRLVVGYLTGEVGP